MPFNIEWDYYFKLGADFSSLSYESRDRVLVTLKLSELSFWNCNLICIFGQAIYPKSKYPQNILIKFKK